MVTIEQIRNELAQASRSRHQLVAVFGKSGLQTPVSQGVAAIHSENY
jgi:hypothetical protein